MESIIKEVGKMTHLLVRAVLLASISVFLAFLTAYKTCQDRIALSNGGQILKFFRTEGVWWGLNFKDRES